MNLLVHKTSWMHFLQTTTGLYHTSIFCIQRYCNTCKVIFNFIQDNRNDNTTHRTKPKTGIFEKNEALCHSKHVHSVSGVERRSPILHFVLSCHSYWSDHIFSSTPLIFSPFLTTIYKDLLRCYSRQHPLQRVKNHTCVGGSKSFLIWSFNKTSILELFPLHITI